MENYLLCSDLCPVEKPPNQSEYAELYKLSGGLPNQEKRREILLKEQKKRRNKLTDEARGISECNEEIISTDHVTSKRRKSNNYKHIAHKLMLSEWLVDVPPDLDVSWFMKICPKGLRCIVVSQNYTTISVARKGFLHRTFKSSLPGNCKSTTKKAILDCIWVSENKTFYILDVLYWGRQDLTECEAEFRFFWLQSRLSELPELEHESTTNKYIFKIVPHWPCDFTMLQSNLETYPYYDKNIPNVEGLLIYHREASYTQGSTPLVGWLRPYMVPEILHVSVASEYLLQRPANYVSLQRHIAYGKEIKEKKKKKYQRHMNKMETEIESEELNPETELASAEMISDSCDIHEEMIADMGMIKEITPEQIMDNE